MSWNELSPATILDYAVALLDNTYIYYLLTPPLPIMPNNTTLISLLPSSSSSSSSASPTDLVSSMLYSSSYSSSMIGEYIGMESCLDLNPDFGSTDDDVDGGGTSKYRKRQQRCRLVAEKKEFPPPIKSLARTEDKASHMPWVLRRYYTGDGRLILKEEKVRHHEYFKAHRSHGRLTLQLVPFDDNHNPEDDENNDSGNLVFEDISVSKIRDHEEEEEEEEDDLDFSSSYESDIEGGDEEEASAVKMGSPAAGEPPMSPAVAGAGKGKCLSYSDVIKMGHSLFEVQAIRPVH